MKDGSVILDVAVDQGGCVETCRPTTHSNPTFVEEGVVHYCVANMPGAVARTSTFALTNATLPYLLVIARGGVRGLLDLGPEAADGINIHRGKVTNAAVAETCRGEIVNARVNAACASARFCWRRWTAPSAYHVFEAHSRA